MRIKKRTPVSWRRPAPKAIEGGRPHKGDQSIRPAELVRKGYKWARPFKGGGRAFIAHLRNRADEQD